MTDEDILEIITIAIDDSLDVDWRSEDAAKIVLERLREEGLLR